MHPFSHPTHDLPRTLDAFWHSAPPIATRRTYQLPATSYQQPRPIIHYSFTYTLLWPPLLEILHVTEYCLRLVFVLHTPLGPLHDILHVTEYFLRLVFVPSTKY